jgi:hypothetical protein
MLWLEATFALSSSAGITAPDSEFFYYFDHGRARIISDKGNSRWDPDNNIKRIMNHSEVSDISFF